jgi:hypothetical protein
MGNSFSMNIIQLKNNRLIREQASPHKHTTKYKSNNVYTSVNKTDNVKPTDVNQPGLNIDNINNTTSIKTKPLLTIDTKL